MFEESEDYVYGQAVCTCNGCTSLNECTQETTWPSLARNLTSPVCREVW